MFVLAAALAVAGCVPSVSTIGGADEASLKAWASEASRLCRERTGREPPTPFTTDGCTLSPDGTWQACCVAHDMAYWCGGSREARREADVAFRDCVADKGSPAPELMYRTTRVSGSAWVPAWWRWGYGWPWLRGYTD